MPNAGLTKSSKNFNDTSKHNVAIFYFNLRVHQFGPGLFILGASALRKQYYLRFMRQYYLTEKKKAAYFTLLLSFGSLGTIIFFMRRKVKLIIILGDLLICNFVNLILHPY